LRCLEWSTGKICWSTEDVGHASVLAADDKLILLNDTGTLILARADPSKYQELARAELFEDAICWTPPLLWQGRLFARGGGRALCVHLARANAPQASTTSTTRSEPAWRFDVGWLIYRERDFPNDAPSWRELTTWFACSGLLFAAAAMLTTTMRALARARLSLPASVFFWLLLFVGGLFGPRLFGPWFDACVFTWPVSLYAALHLTLRACDAAEQSATPRKARWLARAAMLGLVLVGYVYVELCRAAGMFIAWSFLFGLLPAFPLALLAARAESRGRPLWAVAAWTALAFSTLFWSGPALLAWKDNNPV
jgi:hypothetical protein